MHNYAREESGLQLFRRVDFTIVYLSLEKKIGNLVSYLVA